MGITDPTSLDLINKALRKVKEAPIDISSYDLTDEDPDSPDGLTACLAFLATKFGPKTYGRFVLDSWNETLRFFDMFEGRNYLKRHVSLQLIAGQRDYEVNTANFAADFKIEKIINGEVQAANGGFVDHGTREQYTKYIVPYNSSRQESNYQVANSTAPKLWFANPQSDEDGNSIVYFSIYPTVTSNQLLFIPYTKVMTEEIDEETIINSINIPLNDVDGSIYYLAHILAVTDNKPQLPTILQEMELAMLQSSVAHKWLEESGEMDLSKAMSDLAHGGL